MDDEARRDDLEAAALYDLLEHAVTPKFYERDEHGVPTRWVEMVRHTLQVLGPKVLASRMVRDYTEKYYLPAARSLRQTVEAPSGSRSGRPGNWPITGAVLRKPGRRFRSPTWTATACPIRRCSGHS